MKPMTRIWLRFRRSMLGLFNDCRGVAAVEFAMVLPLMLVLFFGTLEFSAGVAVDRKVTMMARTLSDLTSQNISVTTTQLNNIFNASAGIMTPYSWTPVKSTITELYVDPNTLTAKVQWSQMSGTGAATHAPGDTVAIPTALRVADSYLIYGEVSYLYKPIVGYVMAKAGINLNDSTFTRPRYSKCVDLLPLAAGVLPCTPK
jgi:Flp pilus assembly protein TadG